jgi:cation-transporting P-type ATPase C
MRSDSALRILVKHRLPGRLRVVLTQECARPLALLGSVEKRLTALANVEAVRINPVSRSVTIEYRGPQETREKEILECIESVAREPTATDVAGDSQINKPVVIDATERSSIRSLQVATLALPLGLLPFAAATPVFWACILYSAWPSARRAFEVLVRERRLNVDFQDTVSICLSLLGRQHVAGATMTWLIALGDAIRERTALRSKRAIEGMLSFQGNLCWVERNGRKVYVSVSELRTGDCVVIYPGELIPVDGVVLKGRAMIDQKTITGESHAVERSRGQEVFASTIVQDGQLYVRTTRCGTQTVVAQIVHAVETAPLGETRAQNYAEKVADKIVAPNLILSGSLYAASRDIERFLSMVIVDYGTGIRVAAPIAILAAMTDAARQGILIKSGGIVEKLARVDTVVFDKTGTITRGEPVVTEVISYEPRTFTRQRLIALAASAEARLKHPAAYAIAMLAKHEGIKPLRRSRYRFHVGLGVHAQIGDADVRIGSAKFLEAAALDLSPSAADVQRCDLGGHARLLVAVDQKLVGLLVLADEIRPEMRVVIGQLRHRGIRHIVMLTGDNARVAEHVANTVGLDEFISDVMPAEKAEIIRKLRAEGRTVAMVGDGVNDSVALAHADVGVAMRHGADITREAADVVLMEDYMGKFVGAIDISRDAMKVIRQNVAVVTGLNTLALGLSIPRGLVSPATTALISNGSAILASLNSMRPVLK